MKKIIAICFVLAGVCLLVALRVRTPSQARSEGESSEHVTAPQPIQERADDSKTRLPAKPVEKRVMEEPLPGFREWADSMSPDSKVAKDFIADLGAMASISDLVMAYPDISDEALIEQVVLKTGMSRAEIENMVKRYPRSNLSLTEHYEMILQNEDLLQVRDVYDRLGIPFDSSSDCLIDGFRFAAGYQQFQDLMQYFNKSTEQIVQIYSGQKIEGLPELVKKSADEEAQGSQATIEAFYARFVNRYGMSPQTVRGLLTELSQVQLRGVGAFQLNVPRPLANRN